MKLVNATAEATMRALAYYANNQNKDGAKALPELKRLMLADWDEYTDTLKDARDMGEPMVRAIINTYCCNWAVRALKTC